MKRKSLENEACPLARSLEAIGDAWSVLIVRQAFTGDRRFGEFEKSLGVAKNILTVRLRKLVALGVLEQVTVEGRGYQEYVLTEKGRGLFLVLMAIRQWGEGCGGDSPYVLVDKRDKKPVRPLAFRAHDGRELGPDDMELRPAGESCPAGPAQPVTPPVS
ncbi:helix-turn-helix domain-containing protein [Gemmata sp. JC717]|uniref:winged helix-turn-helix transcriptional regulator n=1 Tax=Gemmata algarum TaxID=2975278 RepID=UPI0021BA8B93|nr:helix-turn-helix domain-containing protein [Gemmata algarum]MDY3557173.1 helix-turn-helix domain-containing protein [Gemmata algarum]